MARKGELPVVFFLHEGAIGRLVDIVPRENNRCDVVFIPLGFVNGLFRRTHTYRGVLKSAILGPYKTPDTGVPGRPHEIYFVLSGEMGASPYLLEKIDSKIYEDIKMLEEDREMYAIDRGVLMDKINKMSRGLDERIKELKKLRSAERTEEGRPPPRGFGPEFMG